MGNPSRFVVVLGLGLLAARCSVLEPRLPALPPPPRVPTGLLLVELPDEVVAQVASPRVRAERDVLIDNLRAANPQRADQILAHRIVTGMTGQEVVWAFLSHPTRVRDQGPPGSHTLLWDPDRYWVRLDQEGRVVAAGRH